MLAHRLRIRWSLASVSIRTRTAFAAICLLAVGMAVYGLAAVRSAARELLSANGSHTSTADNSSEEFVPPEYEALRTGVPIVIDGRLDEPSWTAAPDFGPFQFTWFEQGEKEQTIAKMLWDDDNLYVACICQDAHIAARHAEHDGAIPEDDCFEVMLAPNADKPNVYFNIEWNVVGGYVDNHRPHGPEKPRAPVWDAQGVQLAGLYAGTLNDDSDTDQYWIVEAAIPFANFGDVAVQVPPLAGDRWNMNLNRHGGQTNMQYSQWSRADTPKPAFHTPHRFGHVIFSSESSPFGRQERHHE